MSSYLTDLISMVVELVRGGYGTWEKIFNMPVCRIRVLFGYYRSVREEDMTYKGALMNYAYLHALLTIGRG